MPCSVKRREIDEANRNDRLRLRDAAPLRRNYVNSGKKARPSGAKTALDAPFARRQQPAQLARDTVHPIREL